MSDSAVSQDVLATAPHQLPIPVTIVADETAVEPEAEEGIESEGVMAVAITSYLMSPQGHEIAGRIVAIFEDLKKTALSHTASTVKLEKVLQIVIVVAVIVAATLLAVLGKLESPIAVLFGTLVGYVFGKRSS